MDPAGLAALTYATGVTPERKLADIFAEQSAIRKEAGTDQPMGVKQTAQQAAQDAAQKRQQAQAEDLAFAAFVQGTVGTPGSAALAYQRTMANALGNESDYGQQKYKNIAELEAAQRAAAEKQQTALEAPVAAGRLASAAAAKDRANTGANLYGTNEQAKSSKYSVDQHRESAREIARIQERGAAARQGSSDAKQAARELRDREISIETDIKSLVSQRNELSGSLLPTDRAKLATIDAQLDLARDLKRRIRGDTGAAPAPAPTARLKFDAQGNQIK